MREKRSREYFFTIFPLVLCLIISVHGGSNDSNCLNFVGPAHGALIKSSGCTLSVSACSKIESVHLSARFYPLNATTDTILDLGTIAQPPFIMIWNISEIPNQLFRGMGFIADGALKNGAHTILRREGVFIYNKPIPRLSLSVPRSALRPELIWCDTVSFTKAPAILRVSGSAADKQLRLSVTVADPYFSTSAIKEKAQPPGCDILFDPQCGSEPFPSDKTIIIAAQLGKKVSRLNFRKFDDGAVPIGFAVDTIEYKHPSSIKMLDGKGFIADIDVPVAVFGGVIPDSMRLNVVIRLPDRDGRMTTVSLNGASGSDAYCPILWATLRRAPPGILDSSLFVVSVSFVLGLLVTLLVLFPLLKRGAAVTVNVSDLSQEEKRDVQTVFRCIEQNVTHKDISPHAIAQDLAMPASKIESTVKKFSGQPFKTYILKSRVEIAKERLRCSHSSEKSVAESCGFKSVDEMEKYFQKYCRISPYKYRRDNQVA